MMSPPTATTPAPGKEEAMSPIRNEPQVRTLVVIETQGERHVFELDAEATETYENPMFNDPHRFGPRRLEVEGAVLRHVVYKRTPGDDLMADAPALDASKPEIQA